MNGLFGMLLLIVGIIATASPYTVWYLSIGWKLKDVEPSDAALAMHRVSGVIAFIIGLVFLVSSCASFVDGGKWVGEFKERLETEEVVDITFGSFEETRLNSEERQAVIAIIRVADFRAFETGTTYGSSGSGYITFQSGDKVELVLFGSNTGGIEIHPGGNTAYHIQSSTLENWIRMNVTNND